MNQQAKLEKIIRPIVDGQIRAFLKEHPEIVKAVGWYKPRRDKTTTFVNSLSKRIVRDLTCGNTTARLAAALLEAATGTPPKIGCGSSPAAEPAVDCITAASPSPLGI